MVKQAGYRSAVTGERPGGLPETRGHVRARLRVRRRGARTRAVEDKLGETRTEPITPEIEELAKGAPLVLIVGVDDQSF